MSGAPYALVFGRFTLQFPQRVLLRDGAAQRLGSRALGILVALAEAQGELLASETLMAQVWSGSVVDEGALRVHLSALRKTLGEGASADAPPCIENQPGRGYRLRLPVRRVTAAPPDKLPGQVTRMLGREAVVGQLLAQLQQQRCLSICGLGGIGKTTVALAVAHRYAAHGGIVGYVDFAALTTPDQVLAALQGRAGLLLLDNCEHLAGVLAPLVAPLLLQSPTLRLLVTSRTALHCAAESVYRLAPLQTPAAGAVLVADDALRFASVALFAARAAEVRENFTLDSANLAAVCEICRRLDGMPLALELAAARADWLTPQAIAARLDERFALLTNGRRTALPRQQTLRATLDWSYRLLAPGAQLLLRRLATLAGEFDTQALLDAAGDVAGDMAGPQPVLELAAELVAKSLLNRELRAGQVRFHLYETVRHYAIDSSQE